MSNVKNTKEQELAFHEKIEPLMELIMRYCEKEGFDLFAEFKCGSFRGKYRVGDSLLSESELYTQLQLYEARNGKSLIQSNNAEIVLPKKDVERLIESVDTIKNKINDKNYEINFDIKNKTIEDPEEFMKKIIKSIDNLSI